MPQTDPRLLMLIGRTATRQVRVVRDWRSIGVVSLTAKVRRYANDRNAAHVTNFYLDIVAAMPRGHQDLRAWFRVKTSKGTDT